jgi:hypothetical protein
MPLKTGKNALKGSKNGWKGGASGCATPEHVTIDSTKSKGSREDGFASMFGVNT